jgi:hypothetical protein
MRVFHCDHCGQLVFFENTQCVHCGHRLAFLPHAMVVGSLDPIDGDESEWTSPLPAANGRRYRLCANYRDHQVCNWIVDTDAGNPLCESCRLTQVIPDLDVPGHLAAWYRLEVAKRRLLFTLLTLRLPFGPADDGRPGIAFRFMSDASPGDPPVTTGHAGGMITLNVAEADDAERERRRTALGEPYRTLLGHMRHEAGHYYWTRLVADDAERLVRFRELFGDHDEDYASALERHYEAGPIENWQERYISAYAASHAWEDWAETWAHYLHMTDTLETAAACGVSLQPRRPGEPSLSRVPIDLARRDGSFERLIDGWFSMTYLLNNLNRGLGLGDAYPFVISDAVIDKLRFVHETIAGAAKRLPTVPIA